MREWEKEREREKGRERKRERVAFFSFVDGLFFFLLLFLYTSLHFFHFVSSPSSEEEGFFPSHLATTGVRATVGGNLTGDSALCAA